MNRTYARGQAGTKPDQASSSELKFKPFSKWRTGLEEKEPVEPELGNQRCIDIYINKGLGPELQ